MARQKDAGEADAAAAAAVPQIDHKKAERLAEAIAAGTYTVDPELVAKKLIDSGFLSPVNS